MAKPAWMADYKLGSWNNMYKPFSSPSFQIPDYMNHRFNQMKPTIMPASIAVEKYRVRLERSERISEYGTNKMSVELEVQWKERALKARESRKELLGDAYPILDRERSRASFASPHLLLNELARKIGRTRDTLDSVRGLAMQLRDRDWDDLILEFHEIVLENLRYDENVVDAYVKEHKSSSIVHGQPGRYTSVKWPALRPEDHKYIVELIREMLEVWIANWDKWRNMILRPEIPGYGIRGRSEVLEDMKSFYTYDVDRARQIGFMVLLSSWFAYITSEAKDKLMSRLVEVASAKLGCEVILPSLSRGEFWKTIDDKINEGNQFLVGDGSNMEAWTATIANLYCQAVDHGVPQYMSGCAFTSLITTTVILILAEFVLKSPHRMELIAASGDDLFCIGKEAWVKRIESLPKVWEIDEVSTKFKLILGTVLLEDGKGTFPSILRATIDDGSKVIGSPNVEPGIWTNWIKGTASGQAEDAYYEIMTEGTLHGQGLIDVMAGLTEDTFYEDWRKDRLELFGAVEKDIETEVQPHLTIPQVA